VRNSRSSFMIPVIAPLAWTLIAGLTIVTRPETTLPVWVASHVSLSADMEAGCPSCPDHVPVRINGSDGAVDEPPHADTVASRPATKETTKMRIRAGIVLVPVQIVPPRIGFDRRRCRERRLRNPEKLRPTLEVSSPRPQANGGFARTIDRRSRDKGRRGLYENRIHSDNCRIAGSRVRKLRSGTPCEEVENGRNGGGSAGSEAGGRLDVVRSRPKGAPGVRVADLWGNHSKGSFGAYFKLPAGFAVPLHTHTHDMKVIFVSGTYIQQPEGKPEFRLGPGSYMMQPGGTYRHTTSCDKGSECVFFVEGSGAFDLKLVETTKPSGK
jgi:quercetin dioxygenase-like cupin family protein